MNHNDIRTALFMAVSGEWDGDRIPYNFDGTEYIVTRDHEPGRTYTNGGWPWEQRHGKPWQAAMERHVEQYLRAMCEGAGI